MCSKRDQAEGERSGNVWCGGQGVCRGGRQGEGRGGPVNEWVVDEVLSGMEGVIQAYLG